MLTAQPIRFMTVINLIYINFVSLAELSELHTFSIFPPRTFHSETKVQNWTMICLFPVTITLNSVLPKRNYIPLFFSIEWLILKFVATSLSSSDWTSSERGIRWVQNNNFIMYKFLCEIPLCFTNVMYLQIYFCLLSLNVCLWISKSDQTLLII